MSVAVTTNITVGKIKLNFVNSIEIDSSWINLIDTGKIVLPFTLKYRNQSGLSSSIYDDIIKIGDKVKIDCGYDHNNTTIFEGYVSDIEPKLPTTIFVEDSMWLLKKISLVKSFEKVSLSELVDYLFQQLSTNGYPDIDYTVNMKIDNLGKFRINNKTPLQVLEELRKDFGVQSWVRDGVINIGLSYDPNYNHTSSFKFQYNIIKDDLIYKKATDSKIRIRAVSIIKVGKKHNKIEAFAGDADGEVRTMHYYNITTQADLQKIANEEVKKYKYDGWTGSLTSFGIPFTTHGYNVKLIDKVIPDRNGNYYVKQVKYTYGNDGFKQQIFLDRKINN